MNYILSAIAFGIVLVLAYAEYCSTKKITKRVYERPPPAETPVPEEKPTEEVVSILRSTPREIIAKNADRIEEFRKSTEELVEKINRDPNYLTNLVNNKVEKPSLANQHEKLDPKGHVENIIESHRELLEEALTHAIEELRDSHRKMWYDQYDDINFLKVLRWSPEGSLIAAVIIDKIISVSEEETEEYAVHACKWVSHNYLRFTDGALRKNTYSEWYRTASSGRTVTDLPLFRIGDHEVSVEVFIERSEDGKNVPTS